MFSQTSAKMFSQMVVTHKYQKWTNPRVIPDHCNKAQAKNGTKLLLVVSLVLVTHLVQRKSLLHWKMMNLNFESWFQFSDMYELIRFMYKYIWQVQKVQTKK